MKNIWYIAGFRFLIGLTDGASYTLLPLYVGEIVDPDIRGFLSSLLYTIFIVGMLFVNVVGPIMSIFESSLLIAALTAVHFFSFIFMPESPFYLAQIREYQKALASLKILKGPQNARQELNVLIDAIENENTKATMANISDLWIISSNRKACSIFLILLWVQRVSGKVPMMLFTTQIFQESGSSIDATLSVIIYSVVEVLVVILVTPMIDRFGRIPLIVISGIGCSITTFLLGTFLYLKECKLVVATYLNWLPLFALVSHNILFNIGMGYCTMNYLSELFPMNVKAYASCGAEIAVVLLSIISAQFFYISAQAFGMSIPFICYSVLCGTGVIFVYRLVPESKGKTLMEIQEYLISSCEKAKNKPQGEQFKDKF